MSGQVKKMLVKMKPYFLAILLQAGFAGMDVLSKAAINDGMSTYVLVVYRHAIAAIVLLPFAFSLDRRIRPKMTLGVFIKIVALTLLEPVIDQNLYYVGMKYTTATFAAAMFNVVPAITFFMAWIMRLEKVNIRSIASHAKIIGTLATVGGAMIMTLIKGPLIDLIWTRGRSVHQEAAAAHNGTSVHASIKGGVMIAVGCSCYACFMILQAITLKTYPAELSLTVWICMLGTVLNAAVTLVMEKEKEKIWVVGWDIKLLTAFYSAMVCGFAYYIQGVIMKDRGPVFVTAFSPLIMIMVAVMSSFILAEQLFLGRVIGAVIIIVGLYLVLWGKTKDPKTPPPSPSIGKLKSLAKQQLAEMKGSSDLEFVTIDAPGEENLSRDEELKEKRPDQVSSSEGQSSGHFAHNF